MNNVTTVRNVIDELEKSGLDSLNLNIESRTKYWNNFKFTLDELKNLDQDESIYDAVEDKFRDGDWEDRDGYGEELISECDFSEFEKEKIKISSTN